MNALFIIDWSIVVNAIPCLVGWCIFIVGLFIVLKFLIQPYMNYRFELRMKEKAFEREEKWAKQEFERKKESANWEKKGI